MATPQVGAVIGHVSDVIRKPLCARAAQVHVWKNAERLGLVPDPRHPGHAAMQVYENSDVVRHVSWWPGEGVEKGDITKVIEGVRSPRLSMDALSELGENARNNLFTGTFAPRQRQYIHGRENEFSISERNRWMQLPEVSVEIPGMGSPGVWWGLHLPSIASWWDDWSKTAKYVMRSTTNNCAGAVGCALQKGGAECFVPSPLAMTFGPSLGQGGGVSWLCLTPNCIASWAQSLADRLWKLELSTKNLKRDVSRAGPRLSKYPMPGLLPSKDEWLKASHLDGKPRSLPLQAIDNALSKLNKFPDLYQFSVDKYKRLIGLVEAIDAHVTARPGSERHIVVLSLADKALKLVEYLNGQVDAVAPL